MRPQLASRIVVATLVGAVVTALGSAGPAGAVFPGNLRGEVVFASDRDGDAELYAVDLDRLGQRRLTVRRSQEVGASLDVDGLKFFGGAVAYASDREGGWDVYVLRAERDERRLTTHPGGDFAPAFSPRGDEIAFTSDRNGNRDIFVASSTVPESGLRNLTSHPAEDSGAAWSSWAGQPRADPSSPIKCNLASPRIAFHSNRGGTFDIWVVPETGGAAVQVTSGPAADLNPNWSPRCDFIAFERRTGGNYDIWAVRLSNGELTRLTSGPAADTDPVWGPDGSAIAFTTDRDGNEEIYELELSPGPPLAPGAVTNLSQSPAASDYAPDWEPRDFGLEGLIVAPAAGGGRGALTCTRRGTARRDRITGTSGPDVICGLGGNDVIRGLAGDDVLIGGLGRDRLRGGNGRDELRARDGICDMELVGGPGVDRARYDEGCDPRRGVESAL
jgi:WD40-like Beta Propeller Repeat/RTX calcium-binding nonapeptide repeat (4 copies)